MLTILDTSMIIFQHLYLKVLLILTNYVSKIQSQNQSPKSSKLNPLLLPVNVSNSELTTLQSDLILSQKELNRIENDEIVGNNEFHQNLYSNPLAASFSQSLDYVLDEYDRRIRPFPPERDYSNNFSQDAKSHKNTTNQQMYKQPNPLRVSSTIVITAFGPVSDQKGELTVSMFFRQSWKDPRLALPGRFTMDELSLNHHMSNNIWTPDAYFRDGKSALIHNTTVKNLLLRLHHDGTVNLSVRLTVVSKCYMDLKRFPMDTHICKIQIGSFAYSDHEIEYFWPEKQHECQKDKCFNNVAEGHHCSVCVHGEARRLIQFKLLDWNFKEVKIYNGQMGYNQSFLEISFHVQRHIGYGRGMDFLILLSIISERRVSKPHFFKKIQPSTSTTYLCHFHFLVTKK